MEKDNITRIYCYAPEPPFKPKIYTDADHVPRIVHPEQKVISMEEMSAAHDRSDVILGTSDQGGWWVYNRSFARIGRVPFGDYSNFENVAGAVEKLVGRSALTIFVPSPFR